ncbi:MAG: transposase [Nitrospirae bacterium]|nr:transposase [Nitrospirota bacterium]
MARPLRIEYPGAVYHVTARGNARKHIFKAQGDRETLLAVLSSTVKRYNWLCHAYCLMDNHYHLLIETPDSNLSKGMRQLNGVYTQAFNRRHNQCGHIFQGRYKAIVVDKESHLAELCRYVVLNPVRAKIVSRPGDWQWSSYNITAGLKKAPDFLSVDWLLGFFGSDRVKASERFQNFVLSGIGSESPWQRLKGQVLLGDEGFVENLKDALSSKTIIKEIPRIQRHVHRPLLQELLKEKEIIDKQKRNQAMRDAHIQHGYLLKEIADALGIHYTTVSKVINGRE